MDFSPAQNQNNNFQSRYGTKIISSAPVNVLHTVVMQPFIQGENVTYVPSLLSAHPWSHCVYLFILQTMLLTSIFSILFGVTAIVDAYPMLFQPVPFPCSGMGFQSDFSRLRIQYVNSSQVDMHMCLPPLYISNFNPIMLQVCVLIGVKVVFFTRSSPTLLHASIVHQGPGCLCAVPLIYCGYPRVFNCFTPSHVCRYRPDARLALLIGVPAQVAFSITLTSLLLFHSILWCRGVKDRVLFIACSPIVSFGIVCHENDMITYIAVLISVLQP